MSTRTRYLKYLCVFSLIAHTYLPLSAMQDEEGGIRLYTPFTKISVPPGETVDYSIDVINDGTSIETVDLVVSGMPKGWDYTLKSGGWSVEQISVLPNEKKTVTLNVDVPLQVRKGNHSFRVIAKNADALSLTLNVSETGTFKTEFTSEQANMEGHASSNFTFSTTLKNSTAEKQLYSLRSNAPRGWNVTFKPNYKQATAVEIEPNESTSINIEIDPPHNVKAGTYKIPVRAVTSSTSAELELEVVITGSYELELTTPSGLLSSDITAGKEERIELLVKNTGSSELNNIRFSASEPRNWDVTFEPDTIEFLEAGNNAQVVAMVTSDEKAIPGDYAINITAQTPEASSRVSFRISVKTPLLWGWLGFLIIIAALGGVYYLFRKYGRR